MENSSPVYWLKVVDRVFLFGCTIATAVCFHNFLHIPPFLGMMTGLAYLQFFGYYLKKTHRPAASEGKLCRRYRRCHTRRQAGPAV